MSKPTHDEVVCPNCGTKSEAAIWESLNSIMNPNEVEQMLEGTLFLHECPGCHSNIELTYPCLYNDMRAQTMVQYIVDPDKLEEAVGILEQQKGSSDGLEDDALVATRVVTSHNSLREKALIFRDGLDDMAMEVLKAVMMNSFIESGQIEGEAEVFYGGRTELGDIILELVVGERNAQTMAPQALYAKMLAMVESSAYAKRGAYVVDSLWAELFFKNQAGA